LLVAVLELVELTTLQVVAVVELVDILILLPQKILEQPLQLQAQSRWYPVQRTLLLLVQVVQVETLEQVMTIQAVSQKSLDAVLVL
jgi:hypothetical protein|tara:strand:- start:193 stop:450 length:258 start_codon:yes stop_codon:yes gene_type:complete